MIDWSDMEIICGQDHCYWIYSNSRDKYVSTDIHWAYVSEEEFKNIIETTGIDESSWFEPYFDV